MTARTARRAMGMAVCSLMAAGPLVAGAQTTSAPPASVRILTTSASGRFMVAGTESAKNTAYTQWAETMADRLDRQFGMPVAFTRQHPLAIQLLGPGSPADGVVAQCGVADGAARYVLSVNEYVPLDYEELLAAWCRLALAAQVSERSGKAPALDAVPQWLAVGLAQNLAADLRERDRRLVNGWVPRSERPGVGRVLAWDSLPERWYRTRALCGLATAWLDSLRPQGQVWPLVLDRLAGGERITPEWVAAKLAQADGAEALERAWVMWLERQERRVQDLGGLTSVLVEQLRQMASVEASELGASSAGVEGRLSARDLVARRKALGVRLVAEERAQQVQALTIGKAPELVETGALYARFFEGLARGESSLRLRWRLRKAERSVESLAVLTRAREAYLDQAEREHAPGRGEEVPGAVPMLEKSPLETYVDEAEKRFGAPPEPADAQAPKGKHTTP